MKIIDINSKFGVIGISPAPLQLEYATAWIDPAFSSMAGEKSSWLFQINPIDDLPALIDFKLIFPSYFNFFGGTSDQCQSDPQSAYKLSGNIYCEFDIISTNVIYFKGNNQSIVKGTTITLRMNNFNNPPWQMVTDYLQLYIRELGTNNTYQQHEAIPGLIINTGIISQINLQPVNPSFPFYIATNRYMILSFMPSNPFNSLRIITSFPFIYQCWVISGLPLLDLSQPIICKADSNVMLISNFDTYQPANLYTQLLEIKFSAMLPQVPLNTNPMIIETFIDNAFIMMVDYSNEAEASRILTMSISGINTLIT